METHLFNSFDVDLNDFFSKSNEEAEMAEEVRGWAAMEEWDRLQSL